MMKYLVNTAVVVTAVTATFGNPMAFAENRIDGQRPDAPELAAYGPYAVGVRTIDLVHLNQIDILAIDQNEPKPENWPRYNRPLLIEVWYPAASDDSGSTEMRAYIRDGKTEVTLVGQAMRNAAPVADGKDFPLVLISHGYPGNRYLMSHLAENLASKGYVVAAIDHTDSTYRTKAAFGSILYNHPFDQIFVLDEMERMSAENDHFLEGMIDTGNTGLIGYSMGAYGSVITAGGGVTQTSVDYTWGVPHGLLAVHKSGSESHNALPDPRIKTAVTFAPWGMNYAFWDEETLKGIKIPMLFVAGSQDATSGYENGTRAIWSGAQSVDRSLLTFENADHNAGAPYPAPAEGREFDEDIGFAPFGHYADAVWDTVRMNNISQHFITAWLAKYLKANDNMDAYLDLVPNGNDGVWAMEEDGTPKPEHTYWKGFQNRYSLGLRFESLHKAE